MRRWIWTAALLMLAAVPSFGRQKARGWCEKGGSVVVTAGMRSSTKVQQSFPSCTVTVYAAGTVTPSTLYADNSGTPKANPFTADANGEWFFYADNGRYDVRLSGGGLASPYTIGDVLLTDPVAGPSIIPIEGGGTGADNAEDARTNLGIPAVQPISGGGTGATNAADARTNLGVTAPPYSWLTQVTDKPVFPARQYDFAAQSPGTVLAPGNNAITMTPVPAGVNGTDYNHYLWVSGGTGTAEACLITGGTATAGAASGQLIINCAYAHSGAYTVQSVAGGAQEAVQAAQTAGGGTVAFDSALPANFTAEGNTLVGSYPAAVTVNSPNVNISCTTVAHGLFASATFSHSADLFLIQPTSQIIKNMDVSGCSFSTLSSGTTPTRHFFHVRLLGAPYENTSQFTYYTIRNNQFGNFVYPDYFQSAQAAVHFDNSVENINGIYAGHFTGGNVVTGGLLTNSFGDSNSISGNRFQGARDSIDLDILLVSDNLGASQTIVQGNNFWTDGGAPIVIRRGVRISVLDNNIETTHAAVGSNSAMIDVRGSSSFKVYDLKVERNLFSMQSNGGGGSNYKYGVRLDYAEGTTFASNTWGGAVADQAGVICTANTGDIVSMAWRQAAYSLVPAHIAWYGCTKLNFDLLMGSGVSGTYAIGGLYTTGVNYLGLSTGSLNAAKTNGQESTTMGKIGAALQNGMCVTLGLSHALTSGVANTFAYQNGTPVEIRRSSDPTAYLSSGYTSGGVINMCYVGGVWQDMRQ